MKPLFPTYIIKMQAKKHMQGKFLKTLGICMIPVGIMLAVISLLVFLMPGGYESFGLMLRGNFESREARMEYITTVLNNLMYIQNAVAILFAFLNIGCIKTILNIIRNKKFKIKDVFCFYDKWYIALIYPLCNVAIHMGATKLVTLLDNMGMNSDVILMLTGVIDLVLMALQFKFIFIYYTLADTNCENFVKAVKDAWNMTGINTIINNFVLAFSFIGWFIIMPFTGGLVLLYVYPYYQVSLAVLYELNLQYKTAKEQSCDDDEEIL